MNNPTVGRLRQLVARSVVAGTALVVVGAIIGAIVGAIIGAAGSAYSASAEVFTQPTATLENVDPTPTTQDANDLFMGSQVESVSSLTDGLPGGASVTVGQIGLSSVLQITSTAPTEKAAVAAANKVLDRYVALRAKQVTDYAVNATRRLQLQIDQDTTQLAAASAPTAAGTAQRAALSSDYSTLIAQQRSVELTAQTAQPTSVIHSAKASDTVTTSNTARNAILGLLIGAVLGILVVAGVRRSVRQPGQPGQPGQADQPVKTAADQPANAPANQLSKTPAASKKTAAGRP